MQRPKVVGVAAAALFIATIPAANMTLQRFGFVDLPLVGPVASGVVWAGLAFVARDVAQLGLGKWSTLPAIAVGALLSVWLASPALAVASGVAFALSELLDWAVYTPLAERRFVLAVAVSSLLGSAADSALFLQLAFGSSDGWWQLTLVRAVVVAACLPVAAAARRYMTAVDALPDHAAHR